MDIIVNERFLIALLISVGLCACSKTDTPVAVDAPPVAVPSAPNAGKILQLQAAGGYTYAEVALSDGRKVWMAGAPLQLKTGDVVQWGDYAVMRDFRSNTLGRTFEEILFVNAWGAPGGVATQVMPHGTQTSANQTQTPSQRPPNPTAAVAGGNRGKVASVAAAGGYTYIEVIQNNSTTWLAAPTVAVNVGANVTWQGGALMQNFVAKSLGRTFDQIVFVDQVTVSQ